VSRHLADLIILAAVLVSALLIGNAWPAEITYVDIEYQHYHPSGRFPEMPNYRAKEGLALDFNTQLLGPVYWIHALTDPGQYRLVGWNFELGVNPLFFVPYDYAKAFQIYYEHHSQHILEDHHPYVKFPVNDSLGLRWVIYLRPKTAD
jgi:hypothetical protein